MVISAITVYLLLLVVLAIIVGVFIYAVRIYEHGIDLAPLHEKKEQLQEDIESAQNTLSDLSVQMSTLRSQEAKAQQTIAEARAEKEWMDANRDGIANHRKQIANLQEDLKHLNDDFNKRDEEYQQKQLDYQKLSGEEQALRIQAEKEKAETTELKQQKEQLKHDITALNVAHDDAAKKMESIREECRNAQSELDRLKAELAEKNRENERVGKHITDNRKELSAIKDSLKKLHSEYNAKEVEDRELSQRLSLKQVEADTGKFQWQDLNRSIFAYPDGRNRKNEEKEAEWLSSFKKNLQSCGIMFPERMINAFHTGLKVADYSPLVVLAGISGTGKSLLPRLYAHAIGMNFLQVAVQPRWDSPQDMFGFYNYMEGRYKATELSRLLWQFDRYNNEVAKSKCDSILPMNLVLLDEMNLARVEYYFSDMLSKLEVRRGLNSDDGNQRRNAEIEIECRASKNNSETRRLFVGSNTLFVGTMNEDESTQTLSDKVMDRANVLRFGRPEQLNAAPKIDAFLEKYQEKVLTDTIWGEKWIKSDGQNTRDLQQIMEGINAELAKIGRPFAHRVWQAMKAYVNNYPVSGVNGFKNAVADQIEMKVLPKLNGIEKDNQVAREALQNIGNQINVIGDDELSIAFENCRNNNSELFFQWHGIMR